MYVTFMRPIQSVTEKRLNKILVFITQKQLEIFWPREKILCRNDAHRWRKCDNRDNRDCCTNGLRGGSQYHVSPILS